MRRLAVRSQQTSPRTTTTWSPPHPVSTPTTARHQCRTSSGDCEGKPRRRQQFDHIKYTREGPVTTMVQGGSPAGQLRSHTRRICRFQLLPAPLQRQPSRKSCPLPILGQHVGIAASDSSVWLGTFCFFIYLLLLAHSVTPLVGTLFFPPPNYFDTPHPRRHFGYAFAFCFVSLYNWVDALFL